MHCIAKPRQQGQSPRPDAWIGIIDHHIGEEGINRPTQTGQRRHRIVETGRERVLGCQATGRQQHPLARTLRDFGRKRAVAGNRTGGPAPANDMHDALTFTGLGRHKPLRHDRTHTNPNAATSYPSLTRVS